MAELGHAGGTSHATVTASNDDDGTLVISFSGEIDLSNVDELAGQLDQLLADRPERLIVELAELAFMDSTGLALLVTMADRVGTVTLRHPSALVSRVIEVTGLSDTLRVVP